MAQLVWQRDSDEFVSGYFRVRRIANRQRNQWRLEISADTSHRYYRSLRSPTFHRTLSGAKAAARDAEAKRLVQDRVIGHAIVAILAFLLFATLLPAIGSLLTFALAIFAFFVGLRSLTYAVSIGLGDAWGWGRDGGFTAPPRFSDRVVLAVAGWFRRGSAVNVELPTDPAVRVLPPETPE
jgi:hypothetical protein